ncbi:hypothetical protein SASPL_157562 [Salvia splendens]|uniref:Chloride channel protein n=1 Tax=Salvia splendens TaxID=180675 RepID=A0A8X8VUQ7_SALSN|nr:hypothetical protein SASPL_157562 [Salvia splendens]
MSSAADYNDRAILLRSNSGDDLEHGASQSPKTSSRGCLASDLLHRLDRGLSASGRRLTVHHRVSSSPPSSTSPSHRPIAASDDSLGDGAPPEWALLLIGCLLGVATGLFVAIFNRGVHVVHEWAWAGTPNEGAAWLRLQRLTDTWHRILLIPVLGGVIVGVLHGLLEILGQIKQSTSSQGQGLDVFAAIFPVLKAVQAGVTLGTGCSLGPEGPSVDIGKSCANGFSLMMENNRERKIALVAAGAAAGISSEGLPWNLHEYLVFVTYCIRPLSAENSPPFTTAMIILASVVSSTVSNAVLGEKQAFTVPAYDLKSAAELPLYLILGMLCGVVSVAFTRLLDWFTNIFQFIKEKYGLPDVVCPALGGLGAGLIALKYPGYCMGFTNVDEILRTGKTASAPGIWLLAQLAAAKVVATALCRGSGLVGGLYAPSLMIGAAVGAVFGGCAGEIINTAIPGNTAVAEPQAYALVGMAATLASVCSGAVGLAIWVPSVTTQPKESEASNTKISPRGYSAVSLVKTKMMMFGGETSHRNDIELLCHENFSGFTGNVSNFLKISLNQTVNTCTISSILTRGISYNGRECGPLICYPDTDLTMAKQLMEAKGIKQLPVIKRAEDGQRERRRRKIAGVLYYDSIWTCLRDELYRQKSVTLHEEGDNGKLMITNGHQRQSV